MEKPAIFLDNGIQPYLIDVEHFLPNAFPYWMELIHYIIENYFNISEEWIQSGK